MIVLFLNLRRWLLFRNRLEQPFHLPRLLDRDDLELLGRLIVYSVLMLWAAALLGVAVRLFWVLATGSY